MLPLCQVGHSILKLPAQIRILRVAAITGPKTRIDRQLLQIREPTVLRDAGHAAGRQNRERAEVDWFGALGLQIVVQEHVVRDLVIRIVRDVPRRSRRG